MPITKQAFMGNFENKAVSLKGQSYDFHEVKKVSGRRGCRKPTKRGQSQSPRTFPILGHCSTKISLKMMELNQILESFLPTKLFREKKAH